MNFAVFPYEGIPAIHLNDIPDFSHLHTWLSPTMRGSGNINVNGYFKSKRVNVEDEEMGYRVEVLVLDWIV